MRPFYNKCIEAMKGLRVRVSEFAEDLLEEQLKPDPETLAKYDVILK